MASSGPQATSQNIFEEKRFHKVTSTTLHQLREPARMISVYTELLASAKLDEKDRQSVDFLRKAAAQMQNLLDGLAEIVAVSGTARKSAVPLDLPLRQALLANDVELRASGAKVSYKDLPTVMGDFDRLRTLFGHLVKNAIQYHGDGPLELEISAQALDGEWLVRFQDNGPGIDPQFHERIFEPYSRLRGKTVPGNGLGLAVCRAVVDAQGGRIWVESQPGNGAAFCFTLPRGA